MAGAWRVRPFPTLLVVLVAVAGLAGCTGGGDRDPVQVSIRVSPQAALGGEPVAVTVQGLLWWHRGRNPGRSGRRPRQAARLPRIPVTPGGMYGSAAMQRTAV